MRGLGVLPERLARNHAAQARLAGRLDTDLIDARDVVGPGLDSPDLTGGVPIPTASSRRSWPADPMRPNSAASLRLASAALATSRPLLAR